MEGAGLDLESHMVVNGRSSSGKTYFFREAIFARTKKRVVFFNAQRERGFGPEVHRWRVDLLAKPGARVNLCPPLLSSRENGNAAAVDLLARVVDDLIRVGDRVAKDRAGRVLLCVDEAHLYSPKGSPDDPVQRIATNGNRYGIKLCAITQRPAKLSHTVLSQAPVHVLFDLDDYERPYLDQYAVPDDVRAWITEPPAGSPPGTPNRRFAVRTGRVWTKYVPIGS